MTPVGTPSLEVLASWTLSPNQMRWSQSQVSGGHPSALLLTPGVPELIALFVCVRSAPPGGAHVILYFVGEAA